MTTLLQNTSSQNHSLDFLGYLLATSVLTEEVVTRVRAAVRSSGDGPVAVLSKLGLVSESIVAKAAADYFKIPFLDGAGYPVNRLDIDRVSPTFLRLHNVLPLKLHADGTLSVVIADLTRQTALDAIRLTHKGNLQLYIAPYTDIRRQIEKLYFSDSISKSQHQDIAEHFGETIANDLDRLNDTSNTAPVTKIVSSLLAEAIESCASDIHLEPFEDKFRIRFRFDGLLHEVKVLPKGMAQPITSRIKVLARMNIAEQRLPQDGRFSYTIRGRDVDIRVSSSPSMHGESIVLRILDRESLPLDFEKLGFSSHAIDQVQKLISMPYGIVLVTGPTGSGKTTTLYTALNYINSVSKKILTIEDPVEYQLSGVVQQVVMPQIGRTFSSALRSFLRQDPDVILVGEIRDIETTQVAMQAALTGHLILATLHTNSAASALPRLVDMGGEPYLISSTVVGIIAQRLVRRLCPACRKPCQLPHNVQDDFRRTLRLKDASPIVTYQKNGCEHCYNTGYKGRIVLSECLIMSPAVREELSRVTDAFSIEKVASAEGMQSIYSDGLSKVQSGETSYEELMRVIWES